MLSSKKYWTQRRYTGIKKYWKQRSLGFSQLSTAGRSLPSRSRPWFSGWSSLSDHPPANEPQTNAASTDLVHRLSTQGDERSASHARTQTRTCAGARGGLGGGAMAQREHGATGAAAAQHGTSRHGTVRARRPRRAPSIAVRPRRFTHV